VIFMAGGLAGQQPRGDQKAATGDEMREHVEHQVIASMSHHHMHENPHVRLTRRWPERPGDRERAAAIAAMLRSTLERFRDYRVALSNGYEIFMPELPQAVYHFNNYMEGLAETFRFRPDQITSLLYRKTRDGYDLVGGMYTAPAEASEFDLDMRVPLSVAQWHAHVNICAPPRGTEATADWTTFGPEGSITTVEACKAAGGRFFPQLFGWMVHVYPFETAPEKIFGM
jgi:hypothetical protein